MRLRKKFAAAAAVGLIGLGAVTAVAPHAQGSGSGVAGQVVSAVQLADEVVHGHVDMTKYITPEEANILKNKTTNKELLTALNGIQKAVTTAQKSRTTTEKQRKDLAIVARLLDAITPVVKEKGVVPLSNLSNIKAIYNDRGEYEAAVEALAQGFWAGNPAMVSLATNLTSNAKTLKAIEGLASAAVTFNPVEQQFVQTVSLHPAQKEKLKQDERLLGKSLTERNLLKALNSAQRAVATAEQTPGVTAQQKNDLAMTARLLKAMDPVLQGKAVSSSDLRSIESILQNKKEYGNAIEALYRDYRAGDPALAAFAGTFKANDHALVTLAKTFTSNPSAINGLRQSAATTLASKKSNLFQDFGINNRHTQRKIVSNLQGSANARTAAKTANALRAKPKSTPA